MRKLFGLLIGLFLLINLLLGSIAGFSFIMSSDVDAETDSESDSESSPEPVQGTRATVDEQTSPSTYDPSNVFYLCNPTIRTTVHFLKGVPYISDGSDEDLNKLELVNGATEPFKWPAQGQRPGKLKYNQSFTGNPFISLVINSLADASKTVVVTIGIDTNDHYDSHNPTTLEHRCQFPPYQTIGDLSDGTMEEEIYEAYGTWQGGTPPSVIHKGRVILEITMTSPNGDPALVYCGFNYKSSWIAVPYMHTDLVPRAKINNESVMQGYPPDDPIMVGDRVYFYATDSFDPNDDLNGNEKIDLGEVDRLKYRWDWGDGSATSFDYVNSKASHIYSPNDIPLTQPFKDFSVNLSVSDPEGHNAFNSTSIRIYRGNHSPEITSLKINNVEQIPTGKQVTSILDKNIKVWFSAIGTDKDDDQVTYYWDFDNDGEYDISGISGEASTVYYVFSEPGAKEGKHDITLMVSDGTLAPNATKKVSIMLTKNIFPVAHIKARREFEKIYHYQEINVKLGELIFFYANGSYDPDNFPGFDINQDNETDFYLKYRWTFNRYDPSATSGWITDFFYEYAYSSPGNYEFEVILDVDDGVNVTTSEPFIVRINVRPIAKVIIDPKSYNQMGNFELKKPVYFNGSGSYDPNYNPILNYTWEIGTGDNSVNKYGKNMQYIFTDPGDHSVSLKVYDGEFWSTPYIVKVEMPELPESPVVSYRVYPLSVNTTERVYFDASGTTDPDSDESELTYKWYFGDDSVSSSDDNTTIYRYTKPGSYKVTLEVVDETGMNSSLSNVIVTVKNRYPSAIIKVDQSVLAGETVKLSGADSADDDGIIISYIWSFGDGSNDISTNDTQVNHSWKNPGTYTIELTVQDDRGGTSETSVVIEVKEEDSDDSGFAGLSTEEFNTVMLFVVITIIVVVIIIIVVVVLIKTRENI